MKYFNVLAGIVFCLFVSGGLQAQGLKDAKYLAGAVPEVDGKVVFSRKYGISGMSQSEIQRRISEWMEMRLAKNENLSRVVYENEEKGQVVGLGKEWIVFKSTALSLDRSEINYQLTAFCQPGSCELKIEKIRYDYRDGEIQYTAEDWITDKYALNKKRNKLIRRTAKWRRKTVDFAEAIFKDAADALSANNLVEKIDSVKNIKKLPVRMDMPSVTLANSYKEVSPKLLPDDLITKEGKLVIVIGEDSFNMTTMTANAGGSLGLMEGKRVVFSMFSPEQPHQQMDKVDEYVVRFYSVDAQEPDVILYCKQLPSQAPMEGQPRMYIGEIIKAMIRR